MSKPELQALSFAQKPENKGELCKLPVIGNVYLGNPIVPGGNFYWYEALHGGSRVPPSGEIVDGVIRIARAAQKARNEIGRPFIITSWYRPPNTNASVGGARNSRHLSGDAIDLYVNGLMGRDLYRMLDPWWEGGLGQYSNLPYIIHLDARGHRARW